MVGFKAFKGFGRRKAAEPDKDDFRSSSSSTTPSFRVIPREENNPKFAPVDPKLPWSLDRRSWVGSERDAGVVNRDGNANPNQSPRYRVMDPASQYDTSISDRNSMARSSSPVARGQIPNRPFGKTRSQGLLDVPGGLDDNFGDDMFSGIGDVKPPPPTVLRTESESHLSQIADWSSPERTPSPLTYKRAEVNLSPYSQESKTSRDGLLSGMSSTEVSPSPKPLQPPKRFSRLPDSLMEDLDKLAPPPIVRRAESYESFTRSAANEDADAAIVRNSVVNNQQKSRGTSSIERKPIQSSLKPPTESTISSSDTSVKTQSLSSSSSLGISEYDGKKSQTVSGNTTPRPVPSSVPIVTAQDEYNASATQPVARNRLPQMNLGRPSISPVEDSSRSSSRSTSTDLTDSPGNSTIKAVRTLTTELPKAGVMRDTLQPNLLKRESFASPDSAISQSRPYPRRASQSAPNLLTQPLHARGTSSDDDDDIPLAILQANNFPSRGKTPEPRLGQPPSMMSLNQRNSTYTPSVGAPRSSLPPFARKIPLTEDVFMNPMANRASAMRPPPGMSPVPGMPPGGLVGVIAEEERFRGIRRAGGPNPASLNPGMSMGMGGMGAMGMGIPGLGPGLGPANYGMMDPNMVNQQTIMETLQAVQQQNAMLQQLFAMHVQPGSQSPVLMQDGFGNVPGSPNLARPASMMSGSFQQPQMPMTINHPRTQSMVNLSGPNLGPRTMSITNTSPPFPNHNPWETQSAVGGMSMNGLGLNYAPSVAPSERSNVGQPSRYRPVSSGIGDGSLTAGDVRPSGGLNMKGAGMGVKQSAYMAPTAANVEDAKKKKGMLSAIIHPKGKMGEVSASVNGDEGEEEEDWGSFARRRRQKG